MKLAELCHELEVATGIDLAHSSARPVSGGDTHEAFLVDDKNNEPFFLKLGPLDTLEQFISEQKSLELLRASQAIMVPGALAAGQFGGKSVLVLEALDLVPFSPGDQAKLGLALVQMHQVRSPTGQFGASFDNYIGATPQPNSWKHSWADFFTEQRLGYQFQLAETAGNAFAGASEFTALIHGYLSSLDISPALVHGDLWGGNVSDTREGTPAIFDPATYFGDREVDLAFTKLFGGFDQSFYEAYRQIHPAPAPLLHEIYNLYHILNHDHLFGGHYRDQAMHSISAITHALS